MQQNFAQTIARNEVFKTKYYQITYPANWGKTNEEGIVNLSDKDNIGAITISHYSDVNFTDSIAVEAILSIHKIDKMHSDFEMKTVDKVRHISIVYKEEDNQWFSKMYIKGSNVLFVTINMQQKNWEKFSEKYMNVVNTIVF
jgi:hypothetical protein